jgi:glycosyltransferase involved in cell wall biosynthesis
VAYPIALKTKVELTTLKDYKTRKDVFFAGRLVEEKGVGFLIDNWPEIKATLGVERMLIAGDGPQRKELEDKVAKLDGVVMLGRQPLETVVQGMKEAAYVMIPSIWAEPFGNVGVEGVASGAVVISSNRGGLPEAVGEPGVLFGFESPALFSKALKDAVALRKKITSSEAEFEAYRGLANRHLGQFSQTAVIGIIERALNVTHSKPTV